MMRSIVIGLVLGLGLMTGAIAAEPATPPTGNCLRLSQFLGMLSHQPKAFAGMPSAATQTAAQAAVSAGNQAQCAQMLAQVWGAGKVPPPAGGHY